MCKRIILYYIPHYVMKVLNFWFWQNHFLRPNIYNIYVHNICIIEHYVRVYEGMHIYAPAKEAAARTVFMVRLRA
jgi:hypothetical protein